MLQQLVVLIIAIKEIINHNTTEDILVEMLHLVVSIFNSTATFTLTKRVMKKSSLVLFNF